MAEIDMEQVKRWTFESFREAHQEQEVVWQGKTIRVGDSVSVRPMRLQTVEQRRMWFPFPVDWDAVAKNEFKVAAINVTEEDKVELLLEGFPILVWAGELKLVGV